MGPPRIPTMRELDPETIERRRASGEFFWIDLDRDRVPVDRIASALELSPDVGGALDSLEDGGSPARRLHVESDLVVFPFWFSANPEADPSDPDADLKLERVAVLLHGDYLLTVHRGALDLQTIAAPDGVRADRGERYAVYAVLDGMSNTVLEGLAAVEGDIAKLESRLWETGWRQRPPDQAMVKTLRSRLTDLRVRIGPARGVFERVAAEIAQVPSLEGDDAGYFERIQDQLDHIVDRVDAAGETLSNAVQVQLNETTYRLTLVATIFLPLSFVAGFFGMNFGWMVDRLGSASAFWLLGVGLMVIPLAVFALIVRMQQRS